MTQANKILAHMVGRLTSQGEDAATEALAYVLNRSDACLTALNQILAAADPGLNSNPISRIRTQVTGRSGTRPDMVGYDDGDVKRLVVEVKFWAGLRESQISDYLNQLTEEGSAILLFIVPERRLDTFWAGVQHRFEAGSEEFELAAVDARAGVQTATIAHSQKRLALVSWTQILDRLQDSAQNQDDYVAADLRQLRGLAVSQDDEAFLPLHGEEFSGQLPRRIIEYLRIVGDAIGRGRRQGWITTKGLGYANSGEQRGRYIAFRNRGGDQLDGYFLLCVNYRLWRDHGETPLWLGIKRGVAIDWRKLAKTHQKPDSAATYGSYDFVPLRLQTRAEYDDVLDDVVRQLHGIWALVDQSLIKIE